MDRSASSAGETSVPLFGGSQQIAPVVSADGKYFATGHSDCPRANQDGCAGSVVIWDAATGRALGQPIRVPNQQPASGANPAGLGQVGLTFHPDLPLLAIHGADNLVIIVTLEGGSPRVRGSFTTANTGGLAGRGVAFLPSAVAPSPTIITIFGGGTLSVWDVEQGQVATRLGGWETRRQHSRLGRHAGGDGGALAGDRRPPVRSIRGVTLGCGAGAAVRASGVLRHSALGRPCASPPTAGRWRSCARMGRSTSGTLRSKRRSVPASARREPRALSRRPTPGRCS